MHNGLPKPEIIARGLAPDAAIAFWKQRAKLTWQEMQALDAGARHRAFYVTELARHDLVQLVSDGIQKALENGETLPQFKERIQEAIRLNGWHDYRVENIYRTNMQTAYSAGRYAKMQAVKASRPYWQYVTVEDKRRRLTHAALHGMVYPADHEFWGSNYPPNGFRCRCSVRSLSARQVEREGLTVQQKMPSDVLWKDPKTDMEYPVANPGADAGFRNNVGKDWLAGLNLKKYTDVTPQSYEEQRGSTSKRPMPVKSYAELAEGIKARCVEFATNAGINNVITEKGKTYFMATDSVGTIWLNARTFPSCNNFNALRELKSAWNKLATGKGLDWGEEYALESLWHEITHNRQKAGNLGRGDTPERRTMEIFTQWTARRTYPQFLESLGGKAEHQADILKNGFGYGTRIKNFDRLLEVLKVREEDVFSEMLRLMKNVSRAEYDSELKELLARLSGKDFIALAQVLEGIDSRNFEEKLRLAEFV